MIITEALAKRDEKKRLMTQPQTQAAWDPRQMEVGRQTSGIAASADEKKGIRLEEPVMRRGSRRIEVEGPPTYGEVMKNA